MVTGRRRSVTSDIEHDPVERPHQALGNRVVDANREPVTGLLAGTKRLGCILESDRRVA